MLPRLGVGFGCDRIFRTLREGSVPGASITPEFSAGSVGTSYAHFVNHTNDRFRVQGHPTRTVTVTNVGGGTLRNAQVANDGTLAGQADVASGASQTVVAADGAREFWLSGAGDSVQVRLVTS